MIEVRHLESGYDFISLYFKGSNDLKAFSEAFYKKCKRINYRYMELQRKNFRHLPGDVEHFHTDGDARDYWGEEFRHFHIILPRKPQAEDWEELYELCNDPKFNLKLDRNLPIREVKNADNKELSD